MIQGQYASNIDNDHQFIEEIAYQDTEKLLDYIRPFLLQRKYIAENYKSVESRKEAMEMYKYINERINEILKTVKI